MLLQQVMLPMGLTVLILLFIVKNGKLLVNKPMLRPELSMPW